MNITCQRNNWLNNHSDIMNIFVICLVNTTNKHLLYKNLSQINNIDLEQSFNFFGFLKIMGFDLQSYLHYYQRCMLAFEEQEAIGNLEDYFIRRYEICEQGIATYSYQKDEPALVYNENLPLDDPARLDKHVSNEYQSFILLKDALENAYNDYTTILNLRKNMFERYGENAIVIFDPDKEPPKQQSKEEFDEAFNALIAFTNLTNQIEF